MRPVRTLADLKGLRIRVQQSDLMVDMIKALGAEPVALPYGQVLTGLTTRLIDGAENNWPSYVTTDHYTAARYYTLTEHTMSPEVLVMSRKRLGQPFGRGPARFSARPRANRAGSCASSGRHGRSARARRREKAGNVIVADFDQQAVHGRDVRNLR